MKKVFKNILLALSYGELYVVIIVALVSIFKK